MKRGSFERCTVLKLCGWILLLAAAPVCHAESARVCGVELRPSIQRYYFQALRTFPPPDCTVDPSSLNADVLGAVLRFVGNQPVIDCDGQPSCHNEHIVSHEVLHLWLYSRGFEPRQRYNYPLCSGMPPRPETETEVANLIDYFQHRILIPIERKAGFDTADMMQNAMDVSYKNAAIAAKEGLPAFYPLEGAQFLLNLRLRAPGLVPQYEEWLRSHHFEEVISLSDTIEQIANRDRPVTSQSAQQALNDIFASACSGAVDYSKQL
jgi:hypothetical protein